MSNLLTNEAKTARRLKMEKDTIINQFRTKHLSAAREENTLDAVKNLFMSTATGRVTSQEYPDGSTFEGNIHIDGSRSGKGIMYLSNGDVYLGDWQRGNFHGMGTYIFSNGER